MSRSQRPSAAGAPARLARLAGLGPGGGATAARTPFVLLVVVLLGAGMLALLFLNASLNQGSFELTELRRDQKELTDQQQQLQAEVDGYSAPDALAERARELGLVPGGPPAFIGPDGSVLGDAEPAPAPTPEAEETEDEGTEIPEGPVAPQSGPADGRAPAPTPEPGASAPQPVPSGANAAEAPGVHVAPEPERAPEPTPAPAPAPTAPAEGTAEPVTPPAPPAPGPGEAP